MVDEKSGQEWQVIPNQAKIIPKEPAFSRATVPLGDAIIKQLIEASR